MFFLVRQTGIECYLYLVDENLFYKGVDKTKVHGARLHQSHLPSEPVDKQTSSVEGIPSRDDVETAIEKQQPPYPFDSGKSLLALTRKHNVGSTVPIDAIFIQNLLQMTIAQIVHDNEVWAFNFLKFLVAGLFNQKYFGYTDDDIYNKVSNFKVREDLFALNFNRS